MMAIAQDIKRSWQSAKRAPQVIRRARRWRQA